MNEVRINLKLSPLFLEEMKKKMNITLTNETFNLIQLFQHKTKGH